MDSGRVDAVVLPVAVPVHDEKPVRQSGFADPFFESEPFMAEASNVGVVVLFISIVRAHQRGGGNQDFEGCIAGQQRFLEPFHLLLAPQGFLLAIRRVVGGTVVPSFNQPDLEIAAQPVGPVGLLIGLPRQHHWRLFAESRQAEIHQRFIRSGRITVIAPPIMIVLFPVGVNFGEELGKPRLHELFVPFAAQFGLGFGGGFGGLVVIYDVPGADKGLGLEFQNGLQRRIAQAAVSPGVGRTRAFGQPMERRVVHAGGHHEMHWFDRSWSPGAEPASWTGFRGCPVLFRKLEPVEIRMSREQAVDPGFHNEILVRARGNPVCEGGMSERFLIGNFESGFSGVPREISIDQAGSLCEATLENGGMCRDLSHHLPLPMVNVRPQRWEDKRKAEAPGAKNWQQRQTGTEKQHHCIMEAFQAVCQSGVMTVRLTREMFCQWGPRRDKFVARLNICGSLFSKETILNYDNRTDPRIHGGLAGSGAA